MSTLASWWFNVLDVGDFLAGEYFLNICDMILRVTDKDKVRERHLDGASVTGTNVLSQKYYDPFTGTEIDYKPATGKEIMCYLIADGLGGVGASNNFKIWVGTTIDSKTSARDVFAKTFNAPGVSNNDPIIPPFILKAGEYLSIERISGPGSGVRSQKIVGVERDET